MKVKIGEKIYDPEIEPVMLILNDQDKQNIKNMSPECNQYIAFPDKMCFEEVNEWADDYPKQYKNKTNKRK